MSTPTSLRQDPLNRPAWLSRRDFLALSGAFGGQLLLGMSAAGHPARAAQQRQVVFKEPWAQMEELGEGVWAVVSTPLESDDWTTGCNGGLIAGDERVLAVDGYVRSRGARWVGERAKALTGRPPTDVVITHFHGDHVLGVAGFDRSGERPQLWMTAETRELVRRSDAERETDDPVRQEMLDAAQLLDATRPTELDLGGRKVRLHPRAGHTPSDLTIELEEPGVVFFGDLLWNQMFPNYRDAVPSMLESSVRGALRERQTSYVPGHGPVPRSEEVEIYLEVIRAVEVTARRAFDDGVTAAEAARAYQLPESAKAWKLFSDNYFEVAIRAWHKELEAAAAG